MSPLSQRRAARGLTLLEVMISVVILLSMGLIVAQSLSNAIEFNHLLSLRDDTTRTARTALSRLKRDLQMAYLTPYNTGLTPERYRTVFVGIDDSPDTLYFASLNHQRMYLNTRESDQMEVTIWAEPAPRDKGYGNVLYMRESQRIDEEPAEGGKVLPLAYNVRSFELKYLDQQDGEWKDEWDTRSADTPYFLPRAVQIGLVLIAPDPDDEEQTEDVPFLTTVMLDYAPRMPQTQNTGDMAQAINQAMASGGDGTIAGQSTFFDVMKFNKGGFGGTGPGGLVSGMPIPPPNKSSNSRATRGTNGRRGGSRNRPGGGPAVFDPRDIGAAGRTGGR
jgi:general secretion pathway protein J